VHNLLSTYKLRTASGPDGISSIMLRNTSSSIVPSLSSLFNLSLRSGCVPSDWISSNVIPVHKSGNQSLVSNYRPISLLSLVSKVLERIVHNRLSHHLSSNSLLSGDQFGFQKWLLNARCFIVSDQCLAAVSLFQSSSWHCFLT